MAGHMWCPSRGCSVPATLIRYRLGVVLGTDSESGVLRGSFVVTSSPPIVYLVSPVPEDSLRSDWNRFT